MANQVLWGFHNLADAFGERVSELGVGVIDQAINEFETEHNRQLSAMMSLFVSPTTEFKQRFRTTSGAGRLQPLDENGRARPRRILGYHEAAFPLHSAGDAWGVNYMASQMLTVGDVNRILSGLAVADIRWMRDHVLAALFSNTSWSYTDDEHGALTIYGLANGDTVEYQIFNGADVGATDNHYGGQTDAIDNSHDPFETIYTELTEHPENAGGSPNARVIALIPPGLTASVKALAGFYTSADPNLAVGTGVTQLVGSLTASGITLPGKILGYHDAGVWVVEWAGLPAGYIVAVSTGGERPLRMRQHPVAALQGFRQVAERNDYPWYERQWLRHAGFGGWNRVGAYIMEVGDATYDIPTGYESPMP